MNRIVQWLCTVCLMTVMLHPIDLNAQSKRAKRVGPTAFSAGGPCDTSAWKLVFHDEFNGERLDPGKWVTWFTYSDDGSDRCEGCRIMGTSNTIFRDDLVTVENGRLKLGVRSQGGEWYGKRKEHEGGMVHSIGDAKFTYGRFEVRCRIPRGAGLWPAFWGFGGETEIDVFEFCGEQPRLLKGALHRWGGTRFSSSGKHKAQDLSRGMHDYAVEWDRDGISWFLDGRLVQYRGRFVDRRGRPLPACNRESGDHPTAPYFPRSEDGINVILDLAVSAPKAFCKGPKKPKPWPADALLEVDHVRVYQRTPQANMRHLCSAERGLIAVGALPFERGKEQEFRVDGVHGAIDWTVSPGIEIVHQDAERLIIRLRPEAQGEQWVKAFSENDPCTRGPMTWRASRVLDL
ncbi:MAG: glycoside hydrolase family 16 protein [Flavobacteriales bacterium]|nr:glycoside hydrolase family 16 protein [Flavobacteriales bacterium]